YVFEVLHQERDARERARVLPRGDPLVERPRLADRELGPEGDDGVQLAVEPRDALQRPLDQLLRREAARPHRAGKLAKNRVLPRFQPRPAHGVTRASGCHARADRGRTACGMTRRSTFSGGNGAAVLLPGLADAHTHLAFGPARGATWCWHEGLTQAAHL